MIFATVMAKEAVVLFGEVQKVHGDVFKFYVCRSAAFARFCHICHVLLVNQLLLHSAHHVYVTMQTTAIRCGPL